MLTRWRRVPVEAVELPDDEHGVLPQGAPAAVESRPVVPDTGREVVVDVDLVDPDRLEGVALQVQRLLTAALRDGDPRCALMQSSSRALRRKEPPS